MSILIFGPGYDPDCPVCRELVAAERVEPDWRDYFTRRAEYSEPSHSTSQ